MSTTPLLSIEGLQLDFGARRVVENLHLALHAGERVALVGESGSGKTQTALSILRLHGASRTAGRILLDGEDLLAASEQRLRGIRGNDVAMIFQEPMSALNPLFTIGNQIVETLRLHAALDARQARTRAIELLASTGLREPERRIDSYPHELSGGQRQRAMIAMSIACEPRLLIADEPTTALDVTVRARIVRRLLDLQQQTLRERGADRGMAVLLITHDLALVRDFAQRVAVMEHGRIVEIAPTGQLFASPQHPYTRRLLDTRPQRRVRPLQGDEPEVLRAEAVTVDYRIKSPGWRGLFRRTTFRAVDAVSLHLREGETLGVIGESGSGKSSLASAVLGLVRPDAGHIAFQGRVLHADDTRAWRQVRARLQVVFQDPYGALSPRQTVGQIVGEGLALHRPHWTAAVRRERVLRALDDVDLDANVLSRYPHTFSGGQRQRIAIARALVLEPKVVVLDEPTSALDVSIQRQVLDLLASLQRRYRLSYLLISHDLDVVRASSHRIAVLHEGRIVETGETLSVLADPQHAYTRTLLRASIPTQAAGGEMDAAACSSRASPAPSRANASSRQGAPALAVASA